MPTLRQFLTQILPNLAALAKAAPGAWLSTPARLTLLRRLEDPVAAKLAAVVERLRAGSPCHDDPWIDRIESERQRLLRCQDLLAGTFESGHTVAHACTASKPPHDALLLYHLVREFRPQTGLELGTNLGVSCAYQAAAMHVNGTGRMVTVERSLQRVEVARDLHARLGLNNVRFVTGSFAEALDGILRELGCVDHAFIDGHHQMQATLDYFDRIYPALRENAIVLFDDIRWSPGMQRAWRILCADSRIRLAVDMIRVGVCVTTRQPTAEPRHVTRPIAY